MQRKGGIKWLRDRLYSRSDAPKARPRRRLRPEEYELDEDWREEEDLSEDERPSARFAENAPQKKEKRSPFGIALIFSALFFVIALAAATYLFFTDSNVVAPENVSIDIGAPLSVPGGDELAMNIEVVNHNAVPIELADLIVRFPDGTKSVADLSVDLPTTREALGTIPPGGQARKTVRAILFGPEDTEEEITVEVEYRIKGSNAIFVSDKTYNVLISSAPLALSVDALGEITSGQEVQMGVTIASNSTGLLEDVILVAQYPFGWEFTSAQPEPAFGQEIWNLGDLRPGEERTVRIRGILVGADTEERVFRFETGLASEDDERTLAAAFNELTVPVIIRRPFIELALALNGDASGDDVVVGRGDTVNGTVSWVNNLSTQIFDGEIEVHLSGEALDRTSIQSDAGFYRSIDDTIVFSKETNRSLERIAPGDSGRVAFSFKPLPLSPEARLQSPTINVEASVSGNRILEADVPEEVRSSVDRQVRIASNLFLATRAVYSVGPFTNTGPLPPRQDTETTYTIMWSVANTANDIDNARVRAELPSYVEWLGAVDPGSEEVRFDQNDRSVTWEIGDVPAATGYQNSARSVAFQIAFTPSFSQVGSAITLVRNQTIRGLDLFTNRVLQSSSENLTTELETDPNVPEDHDSVAQ